MEGATSSAPSPDSGTTSTAGFPIAPVYAGAEPYNFAQMRVSRRASFHEAQQSYRFMDFGTDFVNPLVPRMVEPKGGIDMNRHLAGNGQIFDDPLDLFKAQPNKIDRMPSSAVRRPSRPQDPNRLRQRGAAAYRKVNRENVDQGASL